MKSADADPEKCECHNWTYCHDAKQIWSCVQTAGGEFAALGHHPGCMYWLEPPHASLTGLDLMSREKMAEALVALTAAYSRLVWAANPPKPCEEDS